MRLDILLMIAGLPARPGLALLTELFGLFDSNRHYNPGRYLAEGRGFVIDYIRQFHQRPTDVTHPVVNGMPLAAVWPALSARVPGTGLLPTLLPDIFFRTALRDALRPPYDGGENDDRPLTPGRSGHSHLFGIAEV